MNNKQIPLSVPGNARAEYKKNYRRLTSGRDRLLLIAGDQKVEHLNDDFFGPKIAADDANPEHLFKIAAASEGGVLATHPGLISRYGRNYRKIPYIIKLNGQTNLSDGAEKKSSQLWWNVADVLKFKKQSGLKIVGIGYTVYLGGAREPKILAAASEAIFQAHQAGLTAVVWMYPRGKNIKEENIHTIAGGAGVAAALDADFVKVKYPYDLKNKKTAAKKFQEVIAAAGRTKVICVGGPQRPIKEMLGYLEAQIKIAGTSGLATGRNLHQRPLTEAKHLTAALNAIIFRNANAADAFALYGRKEKSAKRSGGFLGLF